MLFYISNIKLTIVELLMITMIMTLFLCSNVIGDRYSWNSCFIIHWTKAARSDITFCSTSHVHVIRMHVLQHLAI